MTKKGRHTGRPQVRGRPIGKWGGEVNGAAARFPESLADPGRGPCRPYFPRALVTASFSES